MYQRPKIYQMTGWLATRSKYTTPGRRNPKPPFSEPGDEYLPFGENFMLWMSFFLSRVAITSSIESNLCTGSPKNKPMPQGNVASLPVHSHDSARN